MSANGLSIEMLPARHGDALWIEWGPSDDRHRLLIDGGPTAAADDVLRRVDLLPSEDRHLDLLIVTHIDLDHIGGVIELLEHAGTGLGIGDVWFNDFRHLTDEPPTRGALQGEFLAGLLDDRAMPWNQAFDGRAVRVEATGVLPRVPLQGGLSLVLLSPTPDTLLELRDEWSATLEAARRKEEDRANDEKAPTTRGGRVTFGGDDSKANGSSIAVVAEYGDERWLLAGDAHAEVLLPGLQRYGNEIGEHPVRLDGMKLPHHGSARNITPELLAAIDCRRFLVSTNGAYFKHPDRECIDLIVAEVDHPELVFNYRTSFTEPWAEPSDAYTSMFPGADHPPEDRSAEGSTPSPPASGPETPRDTVPQQPTADDTSPPASDEAPQPRLPPWAHESAPAGPAAPKLAVKVFHGSLERAAHPVLVGHYQATPLSGAEGFIDRRYGGRLSDRLAIDRYPGAIGESLLVEAPRHKHPHRGVLVVGLGEYGELTPNQLVETVRAALVRYALDEADRSGETPAELAISSVLLGGTGEQGLSISASARAVLDGVCEANRGLRMPDGSARAVFTELELWERNAPEAELTFRSFDQRPSVRDGLGSSSPAEYVRPTDLQVTDGAMNESLPVESADARWWRVRIADCSTGNGDELSPPAHLELEYTIGGRLARTGTVHHRVERRRLERILRDAVWRNQPTSGIHTTLFELLFPNQLKWDLMAAQDIQLEVDDATADIPWEMLAARNPEHGERGQLALRAALVRQLKLADVAQVRRSNKPTALVIGNPPVGRLAPPLEGAYAEARSVSTVLARGGFDVTDLVFDTEQHADDETTLKIETALFADDYRIIHIAAHGFYQPDDSTRTGIAIGRDDFLTADVFRQLNVIPDVVFLNCCHMGAVAFGVESGALEFTRRNLNRLGASLARELIRGGVRAVVVAGWAVHDGAANEFASTFYRAMLEGQTFGWAAHTARAAAWNAAPEHSTWGAYQCYGDGGYALPSVGEQHHSTDDVDDPRTAREARRWLEAITNRIESVGIELSDGFDRVRIVKELTAIEHALDERDWVGEGQLYGRLAEAWTALGDFDRAVSWYSRALSAPDGAMTFAGVEQMANLKGRLAASLTRDRQPTKAERRHAEELLEQSMDAITLLERLSESGERSALHAGLHKRRATAATGAKRLAALEASAQCYLAAYRHTPEPYALFNFIQMETLRSRIAGDTAAVDEVIDDFERRLDVHDDTDYWSAVATPDGHLTKALLADAVAGSHDVLLGLYSDAFDCRSTWGERSSTLDHVLDLAELHPDAAQKDALRTLVDELSAAG